ncbi:MAG: hypothetical protein L0K22_08365, partial [Lacticaseibacillus paracasei]|nr:hypothetical protein [Lacticaseibacillus paracasei]
MRLWLQGNLQAHQFIHAEYWKSNAPLVRPLIQQSTLWVVREGATVIAFCGLQQDFIAGFFVETNCQLKCNFLPMKTSDGV